jgi:RNA polymerase sigma factor (sigma-70 family)
MQWVGRHKTILNTYPHKKMPRPYGKINKGQTVPYGSMVGISAELRKAYYASGYKNDDEFPELPCPPQPTEYECPEEELYRKEVSAFVKEILDVLTPRESKVLRYRFGIDLGSDFMLEEIGNMYELSKERIRQIEMKAIRKLKHPEFKLAEVFWPEDLYQPTNRRRTYDQTRNHSSLYQRYVATEDTKRNY